MPTAQPQLIRIDPRDNVAVVANEGGLAAGTEIAALGLRLVEAIPQGHKVALVPLAAGNAVIRYGVTIGYAAQALSAGSWVNEARLRLPPAPRLDQLPPPEPVTSPPPALEGYSFEGYRNPDGSVGTRNVLAVTTTVQCVAGVVSHAVERIRRELLPHFPNVDGVVALEHSYGCGVAIDAPNASIPIRTLRNLARNPNFGGQTLVVSLGCEKLTTERLFPAGTIAIMDERDIVRLQDRRHVGFESMIASILAAAERHLDRLNRRRRERLPASELVVGMQCGGSDAFSGLTANPAVGVAADLLVRAGATVIVSEITEVRDAAGELTRRAASPEVASAIVRELAAYDAYLAGGGADRSANTTPGNKAGGLSNIVEKAMGSIIKSGSTPIRHVLAAGERLTLDQRGLVFLAGPASDFICGTLEMAAGMNVHVFTTGRGTPYGLPAVPVIKVATRSELARRWHDLIDLDAGPIATGEATVEEIGSQLFELILETASGKPTWSERWRLENALTLFNPAPIT
ncbi:MAG: galactarate dehydratase [Casimicrobiaceae bacterium]|nr:galactarate dehydratase [Casimicrobiaceae bacterium]